GAARVRRVLARQFPDLAVESLRLLGGGACQATGRAPAATSSIPPAADPAPCLPRRTRRRLSLAVLRRRAVTRRRGGRRSRGRRAPGEGCATAGGVPRRCTMPRSSSSRERPLERPAVDQVAARRGGVVTGSVRAGGGAGRPAPSPPAGRGRRLADRLHRLGRPLPGRPRGRPGSVLELAAARSSGRVPRHEGLSALERAGVAGLERSLAG